MKLYIQRKARNTEDKYPPIPSYIECEEDKWTYFYLNRGDELLLSRSPLRKLCVLYGKIIGPKKLRVWHSPKDTFLGASFLLESLGKKGVLRRFTPQGRKHKGRRCDAPMALVEDENDSPTLPDKYRTLFRYRRNKAKKGERMRLKYLRSEGNVHHIGLPKHKFQTTKDKQGK